MDGTVMRPLERVAVLLTLMQELETLMRRENVLLREMRLAPLGGLQDDKVVLADALAIELRALRTAPKVVASLSLEVRATLEQASRAFQLAVQANVLALRAARPAIETLLRGIDASLAAIRPGGGVHATTGPGQSRVVAFRRQG